MNTIASFRSPYSPHYTPHFGNKKKSKIILSNNKDQYRKDQHNRGAFQNVKRLMISPKTWIFALLASLAPRVAVQSGSKAITPGVTRELWGNNVEIMAGIQQNKEAQAFSPAGISEEQFLNSLRPQNAADITEHGYGVPFTRALAIAMRYPDVKCIKDAYEITKNGYFVPATEGAEYPLARLNPNFRTWCTDGDPQKKFALLITGHRLSDEPGLDRAFDLATQQMAGLLTRHFPTMPASHFKFQYRLNNEETLLKDVKDMAKQIKQEGIKEPEILIHYAGHADTVEHKHNNVPHSTAEGALQGVLDTTEIHEDTIKKIVKLFPKDAKILFIPDACRAAAFLH